MALNFGPWRWPGSKTGLTNFENELFTDFLDIAAVRSQGYMTAVPLGGGRPSLPELDFKFRYDWDYVSSLKADVIGYDGFNYSLYEIKDYADAGTLGQLLTYSWLWENVVRLPAFSFRYLVAEDGPPGIVGALRQQGIIVAFRKYKFKEPPGWDGNTLRLSNTYLNPALKTSA